MKLMIKLIVQIVVIYTSIANARVIMENDIVKLAEMAMEKPSDFGWWGRDEMFESWGFSGINKHRDSDLLQISNFDFITQDLISKFPDDFEIVGMGHWAVGHVDQLIVKILKDEDGDIEESNITKAFKEAMRWVDNLSVYPIASDEHYSELVSEKVFEYAKQILPEEIYVYEDTDVTVAEILSVLEQSEYYDYDNTVPDEDDMRKVAYRYRWCDYEYKDFWDEFAEENGLPTIMWDDRFEDPSGAPKEMPGQMSIFDALKEA
jgi:hypothetical protein